MLRKSFPLLKKLLEEFLFKESAHAHLSWLPLTWHKNISNLWSPSVAKSAVSFALILLIQYFVGRVYPVAFFGWFRVDISYLIPCPCFSYCLWILESRLEILLSHKKEQNNAICSNMDGPRDCHTEWSNSDTERQISWYPLYVDSKKRGV